MKFKTIPYVKKDGSELSKLFDTFEAALEFRKKQDPNKVILKIIETNQPQ